jgi:RNA helicase HrpA
MPGRLVAVRHQQQQIARLQKTIASRQRRSQPVDRSQAELKRLVTDLDGWHTKRSELEPTITYPEVLPVAAAAPELVQALRQHQVIVVTGETGSGKTTQLPKMLWEAGCGRQGVIACTQPRRLAAISVASRLQEELQCDEPTVAHAVRFDDRSAAETAWCVCTDGWLLAGAAQDPDFLSCDAIIIDEAHERSVTVDALLGLVRQALARRDDLKVVITSATLNAEAFAAYFQTAANEVPIFAVGGRQFPVAIQYESPANDEMSYQDAAVSVLRREHEANEDDGDFLCFLPSEADILTVRRRLRDLPAAVVLPLYARLSPGEQRRVFASARGRKIILATNVAETSLTVPNITLVVDAGLARVKRFQVSSRLERLPIEAISQANANQRAGRAGRVRPGRCIRLFAEEDFTSRDQALAPEIKRANLAGLYLEWLARQRGDPRDFPWLDPPTPAAWQQAALQLREIGAVQATGADELTPLGRQLAQLPLDPALARLLVAGIERGVVHETATIAAFLSAQDPRQRPNGHEGAADRAHRIFYHEAGDIAWALRVWQAYAQAGGSSARHRFAQEHFLSPRRMREWADTRHQVWSTLRQLPAGKHLPGVGHDIDAMDMAAVHRCLVEAMPAQVLRWNDDEHCYRGTVGKPVQMHPGSMLASTATGGRRRGRIPWLLATDIIETSQVFARGCVPIEPDWLVQAIGDLAKRTYHDVHFDPKRQQVSARATATWRGLQLPVRGRVDYGRIEPDIAEQVFVQQALLEGVLHPAPPVVAALRSGLAEAASAVDRLRDGTVRVDEAEIADHIAGQLRASRHQSDQPISSQRRFAAWCRSNDPEQLIPDPADLLGEHVWREVEHDWPQYLLLAGTEPVTLRYRYDPDRDDDGVTLILSVEQAQRFGDCAWHLPGARQRLAERSVVALPKAALAAVKKVGGRRLVRRLQDLPADGFVEQLRQQLQTLVGHEPVQAAIPSWAWPRYVVHDGQEEVLVTRDGEALLALRSGGLDWEQADTVWPAAGAGYVIAGPVSRYGRKLLRQTIRNPAHGDQVQGQARGLCMADAFLAESLPTVPVAVIGGTKANLWMRSWVSARGRAAPQESPELPDSYLDILYRWLRTVQQAWQDPERQMKRGSSDLRQAAIVRSVATDLHRWSQPSWLQQQRSDWFERLPALLAAAQARLQASHETLRGWLVTQETVDVLLARLLAVDQRVVELSGAAEAYRALLHGADETSLVALPVSVRRDLVLHPDMRALPAAWGQRVEAFLNEQRQQQERWRHGRLRLQRVTEHGRGMARSQALELLHDDHAVIDLDGLEQRIDVIERMV